MILEKQKKMVENNEEANSRDELIFFDTFSHDLHEVNLSKNTSTYIKKCKLIISYCILEAKFRFGAVSKSSFHF